jgi:fluoroacetyl-CoA thioesterase
MKSSLRAGLLHQLTYRVPVDKTVPHVFPDSDLFRTMPQVLATSYLVGLIEWACMEVLKPHLEDGEQSVGTGIQITHAAATPPGLGIQVDVSVESVDGRRIRFHVKARDEIEPIGEGTHERFIIDRARFMRRVAEKASPLSSPR